MRTDCISTEQTGSRMTAESKLSVVPPQVGIPVGRGPRESAGLLLGRLTVLPALILLPFLLVSFPLLLVGYFKPVPVVVGWLALAGLVVPLAWRRVPSVTGAADWGTAAEGKASPTPRWVLWSLAGISVAFGAFQAAYHSQFVIVQLDAASYMQFANWISHHGSLPIPQDAAAFGNASGITFASAAFYQVGHSIVPQFMAGLPMLLSTGFWAGGVGLALLWGPVLGALGIFTFGGLVARLVGPRWAPLGALALGAGIPEAYVSRNTYSEPLAQILLLGALSLWIDAQRADRGEEDAGRWRSHWRRHARSASHVLAGVAGLLFGIIFLVRVDGPADILLVVPYCGLLILRGQRQAIPLIAGLIAGTGYGAVDAWHLSLPYLEVNKSSVIPMMDAVLLMTAGTTVAVWLLRGRGSQLRTPARPWLTRVMAVLPFVVIAAFIIRPLVERNWAALQDAPLSLCWVYWYAGGPTIALAVIATSQLGRRCAQGDAPAWVLPLLSFGWAITWFLLRPAISPSQPYASRRMVADVLPGLVLLAVWVSAWATRKMLAIRLPNVRAFLKRSPGALVTACYASAVLLPPMIGNFGLGIKLGGPLGVSLSADGLALQRTYTGEVGVVDKICASIPEDSSVLIDDSIMNTEFGQVIRGTCNVPVAGLRTASSLGGATSWNGIPLATVRADVLAIEKAGRHPVVLAPMSFELDQLGNGVMKLVVSQGVPVNEGDTSGTPRNTFPQWFTVYSWEPAK
jgi:hypothetical protein